MAKKGLTVVSHCSVTFEEDGTDRTVNGLVTSDEYFPGRNAPYKYNIVSDSIGLIIGLSAYSGYRGTDIFLSEEEIAISENDILPLKKFSFSRLDDECVEHVVTDINYR